MSKIKGVTAKWVGDDVEITIETSGRLRDINLTRSPSSATGIIRFSFIHPDYGEKLNYDGIVEGDKLFLYPLAGKGVLSTEPIYIQPDAKVDS